MDCYNILSTTTWHLPRAFSGTEQHGHLPSASAETDRCQAANLQHPLRGIQGGQWGTLCSREIGGQVFRQLDIFRSWFHDPNPRISSYLEKHTIPSWWYQLLMKSRKPFGSECLIAQNYPFIKILYIGLAPLPLWSSLRDPSEVLSPRLQSSFRPKSNLTCSFHTVHLFSRHIKRNEQSWLSLVGNHPYSCLIWVLQVIFFIDQ